MEALNRKPNLGIRKSMELEDGTRIDVIGITARKSVQLANNKKLSDADRGIHLTAAKILVNGSPIVCDDLLDSFTDDEITRIIQFANDIDEKEGKDEKNV